MEQQPDVIPLDARRAEADCPGAIRGACHLSHVHGAEHDPDMAAEPCTVNETLAAATVADPPSETSAWIPAR